jgi:hypothetical protein
MPSWVWTILPRYKTCEKLTSAWLKQKWLCSIKVCLHGKWLSCRTTPSFTNRIDPTYTYVLEGVVPHRRVLYDTKIIYRVKSPLVMVAAGLKAPVGMRRDLIGRFLTRKSRCEVFLPRHKISHLVVKLETRAEVLVETNRLMVFSSTELTCQASRRNVSNASQ